MTTQAISPPVVSQDTAHQTWGWLWAYMVGGLHLHSPWTLPRHMHIFGPNYVFSHWILPNTMLPWGCEVGSLAEPRWRGRPLPGSPGHRTPSPAPTPHPGAALPRLTSPGSSEGG